MSLSFSFLIFFSSSINDDPIGFVCMHNSFSYEIFFFPVLCKFRSKLVSWENIMFLAFWIFTSDK
jgi:hypothetical protein